MSLLSQIFTWWNGQTIGARLYTARKGRFVGEDEAGNRYYRTADDVRRWVIYNGEAEASRVPPDWHGWLHHTFEAPPTDQPLPRKRWELDHQPNRTGAADAYRPKGSLLGDGERKTVVGDYQAWKP